MPIGQRDIQFTTNIVSSSWCVQYILSSVTRKIGSCPKTNAKGFRSNAIIIVNWWNSQNQNLVSLLCSSGRVGGVVLGEFGGEQIRHTAHYLLAFDGDDHFGPLAFGTKMDCIMGSTGGRFMPIYDLGRDDDDAPDASRGCFDADDDEDDWGAFVGCGWVVVVRERVRRARLGVGMARI